MVLETERLILRGWRDDDAPSLFEYAKDERVGPIAGWPAHKNVAYSKAVIRTIFNKRETYAICLKGTDKPIGSIGLVLDGSPERPLETGEAELGYWLGVPFWGRGLATEAGREMIRHGFQDLDLNRIYCCYFKGNERSRKVQRKCGFQPHHINTQCKILMLNEIRTEYINYLDKIDWLRS